ncbi:MAG: hypothetical protein ACRETB_09345 [Steroidobacteraceae bacterium]
MRPTTLLKYAVLPLAAMCLAPLACLAQGSAESTIEVLTEQPKPGMTAKFEEGVKAVDTYAQSHGDTAGTDAFEVIDGPDEGQIAVLLDFNWADQDRTPSYGAGLDRVAVQKVEPYLAWGHVTLWDLLPALSNLPPANAPAAKYYERVNLVIKPSRMGDFLTAVRQIAAVSRKGNGGPHPGYFQVYVERSGGNADAVIIAIPHVSMASFAQGGDSPFEMLRKAYGEQSVAIWSSLERAIASEQDDIVRYRPDLSFIPSGQAR